MTAFWVIETMEANLMNTHAVSCLRGGRRRKMGIERATVVPSTIGDEQRVTGMETNHVAKKETTFMLSELSHLLS